MGAHCKHHTEAGLYRSQYISSSLDYTCFGHWLLKQKISYFSTCSELSVPSLFWFVIPITQSPYLRYFHIMNLPVTCLVGLKDF